LKEKRTTIKTLLLKANRIATVPQFVNIPDTFSKLPPPSVSSFSLRNHHFQVTSLCLQPKASSFVRSTFKLYFRSF